MSFLEFCKWIQFSPLLVAMRGSPWLFPVVASVHLMGLAVIGGAVLVGDLRLLGFGLSRQPATLVVRDAERWLIAGELREQSRRNKFAQFDRTAPLGPYIQKDKERQKSQGPQPVWRAEVHPNISILNACAGSTADL